MLSIKEYLETSLWATEDSLNTDAFTSQEYKAKLQKELDEFYKKAEKFLTVEEIERGHIEHDFFLTRNGHGAGFWDGDYVNGKELTDIAKSFGEDWGY